jgi:hypothetical protein
MSVSGMTLFGIALPLFGGISCAEFGGITKNATKTIGFYCTKVILGGQ